MPDHPDVTHEGDATSAPVKPVRHVPGRRTLDAALDRVLEASEVIVCAAEVDSNPHGPLVVLTDRRLIWLNDTGSRWVPKGDLRLSLLAGVTQVEDGYTLNVTRGAPVQLGCSVVADEYAVHALVSVLGWQNSTLQIERAGSDGAKQDEVLGEVQARLEQLLKEHADLKRSHASVMFLRQSDKTHVDLLEGEIARLEELLSAQPSSASSSSGQAPREEPDHVCPAVPDTNAALVQERDVLKDKVHELTGLLMAEPMSPHASALQRIKDLEAENDGLRDAAARRVRDEWSEPVVGYFDPVLRAAADSLWELFDEDSYPTEFGGHTNMELRNEVAILQQRLEELENETLLLRRERDGGDADIARLKQRLTRFVTGKQKPEPETASVHDSTPEVDQLAFFDATPPAVPVTTSENNATEPDELPEPSQVEGTGGPGELLMLIDMAWLDAGEALISMERGINVAATVQPDGRVEFDGRSYASLTDAAIAAYRATAQTTHLKLPLPTDGWTFWAVEDNGVPRRLIDLIDLLTDPTAPDTISA